MARGFLSGVLWGAVIVGGALAIASVVTGPVMAPQPNAVDETPTNVAPEAPAADALPSATPQAPSRPTLSGEAESPGVPDEPNVAQTPGIETESAPVPQTGGLGNAPDAPAVPDVTVAAPQGDAPVLPSPQAPQPQAPASENLSITTNPAQPIVPDVPQTSAAPAVPETQESGTPEAQAAVSEAAPVVEEETTEETAQPGMRQLGQDGSSDLSQLAPNVTTNRLPTTVSTTEDTETTEVVEAVSVDPDVPPLERFAAPLARAPDKALMSIILIDDGSTPLGLEALEAFPYPLTFAVDVAWDGAAAAMQRYRDAGFEVMALANLPEGAVASDVEVSLQAGLDLVPEAVAVLEGDGTGLQSSREMSDQVARVLANTGHGLVLYPEGLNTAVTLAQRAGVQAEALFRDFDGAGQNATVIRRFLDQAAFKAGQEGGVIMLGRLRADTISALLIWGLQDRASRVSLVPVSYVLTRERAN